MFRPLVLPIAALLTAGCSQRPSTDRDFASEARRVLPVEEPYEFHRQLSAWKPELGRDTGLPPAAGEMEIAPEGWTIRIPAGAGDVLRNAAEDFRSHVPARLNLEATDSLAGWAEMKSAVVAGTRDLMPGCGAELRSGKDYQIIVSPERIAVCGYDERGAMHGLYNLEARFRLRGSPALPRDLNTTRHSLYRTRMTLSALGWMEWPDAYLSFLAHHGFDSIFASVYANPNGVNGPPPHWDRMRGQDPAVIHDLIRRAARYGIDLYCPIIYLYTGEPANEAGLRKLVRDIVTEFPRIRGYILLTEGFFYKTWFGAGGHGGQDLRDWVRNWARGVAVVTEECRKIDPRIEVLPWDYNVDFRPHQVDVKRFVIQQLPQYSIPLLTFENGKSFTLDGQRGSLADYSINEIGPSEVTAAQIEEARKRGMRAVYAKADTAASWQFGTFPYLPFPYQWHARYQALEKSGIDGALESWSYGTEPNFMVELRSWYCWSAAPELDATLRAIARREFGPGSEERVLSAWRHFSEAARLVPATGPTWITNNAVATPMFLEKGKPRMYTQEHSWTDDQLWARSADVNPYWPYAARWMVFYPDFSNKVNAAERAARPFTLPVFQKYLLAAADEMERGLGPYREAASESKKPGAYREVMLAEHLERMLRSAAAVLQFEDLRFRSAPPARMAAIVREEIARTEASLEAARRDSRLGYEWEMDYIYTPAVLQEKLEVLRETLDALGRRVKN